MLRQGGYQVFGHVSPGNRRTPLRKIIDREDKGGAHRDIASNSAKQLLHLGRGGSIAASWHVNSYIGSACVSRSRWSNTWNCSCRAGDYVLLDVRGGGRDRRARRRRPSGPRGGRDRRGRQPLDADARAGRVRGADLPREHRGRRQRRGAPLRRAREALGRGRPRQDRERDRLLLRHLPRPRRGRGPIRRGRARDRDHRRHRPHARERLARQGGHRRRPPHDDRRGSHRPGRPPPHDRRGERAHGGRDPSRGREAEGRHGLRARSAERSRPRGCGGAPRSGGTSLRWRRSSRFFFTWRRTSSASSWIEPSISGLASLARIVVPLRRSVASATYLSAMRGFFSSVSSTSRVASSETCLPTLLKRLRIASSSSAVTSVFRPRTSILTASLLAVERKRRGWIGTGYASREISQGAFASVFRCAQLSARANVSARTRSAPCWSEDIGACERGSRRWSRRRRRARCLLQAGRAIAFIEPDSAAGQRCAHRGRGGPGAGRRRERGIRRRGLRALARDEPREESPRRRSREPARVPASRRAPGRSSPRRVAPHARTIRSAATSASARREENFRRRTSSWATPSYRAALITSRPPGRAERTGGSRASLRSQAAQGESAGSQGEAQTAQSGGATRLASWRSTRRSASSALTGRVTTWDNARRAETRAGQSKTARSTSARSFSQPDHGRRLAERGVGVLQAVAGEDADDRLGRRVALDHRQAVGEDAGDRRGGGRLAEDSLARGEEAVCVEDLLVGDGGDAPARLGDGGHRLLPAGRVADADRRGDRLGVGDRLAADERRCALGLEAVEPGRLLALAEAAPPRGDVAGVADGDRERTRRLAELLDHLEGRGLLALDPVRVDRVHELDRVLLRKLADEGERVVEVASDRDHARAVHQRLGELADRDLALGDDDGAAHPGPRRVGGGACRRVAGRGADHGLSAAAGRARDGDGHAAVLERAGRVGALELEEDPRAHALRDHGRLDQRRRALVQGHHGVAFLERQVLAVALDQPGWHGLADLTRFTGLRK